MKNFSLHFCLKTVKIFLLLAGAVLLTSSCGFLNPFGSSNSDGQWAAQYAHKYIGVPYVYGGHSPKGFDCSGLVSYVYQKKGVKLPRSSAKQAKAGHFIKKSRLRAGDLVFFRSPNSRRVSHVGIYIGEEQFIHAPGRGKKVRVASLDNNYFKKMYHSARRVI